MASSGTPDGEGWRSGGPQQHGEQNMHTRPPSAPEVPHATNLRGATPPIVPLMSRFSLGWSVVAAFTAGALTFYTVRYIMRQPAPESTASSLPPPQVKLSRTTSSSGSSPASPAPSSSSPAPAMSSAEEQQQQQQRMHQRVQQTLDRTTLASRERIKRWLDRVSRRQPGAAVSAAPPPPPPPYYRQGVFEGTHLKRRLLPPTATSSSSSSSSSS